MGTGVVFAVAGSKGGVGKTTTSINLCAVLAELGHDVVLVEMDLAMANVGDFLDIDVHLEGDDPTLHEVLGGRVSVVDATYESPCGFDVVPSGASLQGFANANVDAVSGALATLRFAYDVVVLDTGAGVMPSTLISLALADETILISSPRVASVRDTKKTRDLTRRVGGSVAGAVFVKSGTGRSPGVDRIAEFLAVDLLGHIPEDDAVASAQDVGQPVVTTTPESDAATAYRALGDSIHEQITSLDSAQSTALSVDRPDEEWGGFAFVDTEAPVEGGDAEADVERGDVGGDDDDHVQDTAGRTAAEEVEADRETEAEDGAGGSVGDEGREDTETDDIEEMSESDVEEMSKSDVEEMSESDVEERDEDDVEEVSATPTSDDAVGTAEGHDGSTGESSPLPIATDGREPGAQAITRDGANAVLNAARAVDTEEESATTERRPPEPVSAEPTDATEALDDGRFDTNTEETKERSGRGVDTDPSVTKRFIDKAREFVDRSSD